MCVSELYMKDMYLNKNINLITNKIIIEYDLKSANTSLCREYKLLPEDEIENIENMSKKNRVVNIGKIMRKNHKFKNELKLSFIDIRRRFFIMNNIQDDDILSIKKDAIFCLKRCEFLEFGNCKFVEKNIYSSYMYLNNFEFYYGKKGFNFDNSILDIKGIDNEILKKHDNYLIKFFKTLFSHFESSSQQTQYEFIKRFLDKYKTLSLDVGYYREFNQESKIRLTDSYVTYDEEIFIPYEYKQKHLMIDYNFFNIIIPIIKMII